MRAKAERVTCAIDQRLRELQQRLELGPRINPRNGAVAREAFFSSRQAPRFEYPDPPVVKSFDVGIGELEAPGAVVELYEERLAELRQQELLFRRIGGADFTAASVALFGAPGAADAAAAEQTLGRLTELPPPGGPVTAEILHQGLQARIEELGLPLSVALDAGMTDTVSVDARAGLIKLKADARISEAQATRLLVRAVDVHAVRILNGRQWPWGLFSLGTAGYRELEQGLVVYREQSAGQRHDWQAKNDAARCLAVHLSLSHGFNDVFEALRPYFDDSSAYRHVARAKRGLGDTSRPGALTCDYHGVSGPRRVREYLETGGARRLLYAGKVGFRHLPVLNALLEQGGVDEASWVIP